MLLRELKYARSHTFNHVRINLLRPNRKHTRASTLSCARSRVNSICLISPK